MRNALAFSLLFASAASHASLVTNGSFEAGTLPANNSFESVNPGETRITGWTISAAEIAWERGTAEGVSAYDGACSLDLFGFHDAFPSGVVSQSLATAIGQTYRIGFAVGTYGGYVAQVRVRAGSQLADFTNSNGNYTWLPVNWSFVATSTSTVLSFEGGPQSSNVHAGLDNVSVEAVPEPEAFAALFFGGLAFVRRRRAGASVRPPQLR